jgi:hypothetical protein
MAGKLVLSSLQGISSRYFSIDKLQQLTRYQPAPNTRMMDEEMSNSSNGNMFETSGGSSSPQFKSEVSYAHRQRTERVIADSQFSDGDPRVSRES